MNKWDNSARYDFVNRLEAAREEISKAIEATEDIVSTEDPHPQEGWGVIKLKNFIIIDRNHPDGQEAERRILRQ